MYNSPVMADKEMDKFSFKNNPAINILRQTTKTQEKNSKRVIPMDFFEDSESV